VRGRKRHLLVDTEGLVVKARVQSAKVADQDGIKRPLEPARGRLPRLSYLRVDADQRGRGKEWAERSLGVEVEVVNRSPKPPPEKILRIWAREWFKEGREMDLGKLPTRPAFENLPRRWVPERTFAWSSVPGSGYASPSSSRPVSSERSISWPRRRGVANCSARPATPPSGMYVCRSQPRTASAASPALIVAGRSFSSCSVSLCISSLRRC
jgi:hypothetical protein